MSLEIQELEPINIELEIKKYLANVHDLIANDSTDEAIDLLLEFCELIGKKDIKNDLLLLSGRIITPEYIINSLPDIYECSECRKRSFSLNAECKSMKKIESSKDPYFIDSSFILYSKPSDSKIRQLCDDDHHLLHPEGPGTAFKVVIHQR
jgi:hypothetical protein